MANVSGAALMGSLSAHRAMRRQGGIALITAMLIAAIAAAAVVAISARQHTEIRRSANIAAADRALELLRNVELLALDALRADAARSQSDDLSERWSVDPLEAASTFGKVSGSLEDLQGRFNLTNLALPHRAAAGSTAADASRRPELGESVADAPADVARLGGPFRPVLEKGNDVNSAAPADRGRAPNAPAPTFRAWICDGRECAWQLVSREQAVKIRAERWDGNVIASDSYLASVYVDGIDALAVDGQATDAVPPTGEQPAEAPMQAQTDARGRDIAGSARSAGSPGVAATSQEIAQTRFRLLLNALDIDASLVQAILDWIDEDSETRFPNGAEDDYYLGLERPYRAANRAPGSVRELLLVRGVTEEIFERLEPFVVCLPEPTALNVNTAPEELLMSLAPGIDRGLASLLIRAREVQAFTSIESFVAHPLLRGRLLSRINLATGSSWFALKAVTRALEFRFRSYTTFHRNGERATLLRRKRGYFDG